MPRPKKIIIFHESDKEIELIQKRLQLSEKKYEIVESLKIIDDEILNLKQNRVKERNQEYFNKIYGGFVDMMKDKKKYYNDEIGKDVNFTLSAKISDEEYKISNFYV